MLLLKLLVLLLLLLLVSCCLVPGLRVAAQVQANDSVRVTVWHIERSASILSPVTVSPSHSLLSLSLAVSSLV